MTSLSPPHRSCAAPPLPPPPFPEPTILNAKRVTGLVRVPDLEDDGLSPVELSFQASCSSLDDSMMGSAAFPPFMGPTAFQRRNSTSGNILVIEHPGNELPSRAYLMQRKINKTTMGSVRVGFVLRFRPPEERTGDDIEQWELIPSIGDVYPFEMVAIKLQDRSKVLIEHKGKGDPALSGKEPLAEVCSLQMIASYYESNQDKGVKHVLGTHEIAVDNHFLYIIMPYHREGPLFQYCAERGRLREVEARHFFNQIVKGIETLQAVGLCHRDLSLENILLRGSDCCISGLGYSLPIPRAKETGLVHLATPQPNYVRHLQYSPPEVLRNEPFDAEGVDLWAAGIILLSILFGTDAPFIGPVEEDRKFRTICVKGNLKYFAERWEQDSDLPPVSPSALDLVQSMLRADPKDRLTLAEIKSHPWLTGSVVESIPS